MNKTLDAANLMAAGVFLTHQLERLDTTINLPLREFTWPRDCDRRGDIQISDEVISHLRTEFHAVGQGDGTGKSWFSDKATIIPEVSTSTKKGSQPVYLWAQGLSYSVFELERAMRLNQDLKHEKTQALNHKWNLDVNDMLYVGDKDKNEIGLVNNPDVFRMDVDATWASLKAADIDTAPDKILAQVDAILDANWAKTNRTMVGSRIILPPRQFALLVGTRMKDGNNKSVMKYIKEECLSTVTNGSVEITYCQALTGAGKDGKDRMVVYTKNPRFLRFPLTMLQHTEPEKQRLNFESIYFCAMSAVEVIYPETLLYADGI